MKIEAAKSSARHGAQGSPAGVGDFAGYRPDIDGLRALSVLSVLLFHGGVTGFAGGFVGVDVFFVISGFLITGIIHKEMKRGSFSLAGFYERRIRRIFPALLIVLVATTAASTLVMLPADLGAYSVTAIGTLLSASNIVFLRQAGYFQPDNDLQPLLHTWSLGVEEQFYIGFPIALAVAYRWRPRLLFPLVGLVFAVSLVACIALTETRPIWAFYLLPTRAWELMLGAMLALRPGRSERPHLGGELLSLVGLASILASVMLFRSTTPFPGVTALLPCLGAALLIRWAPNTVVGRALSSRLAVFIGLISYPLYLWHWPLLSLGRYVAIRPLTIGEVAVLLAVAGILAIATRHFIEQPIRRMPLARSRGLLFSGTAAATMLGVSCAGALLATEGWPGRVPSGVAAIAAARTDLTSYRDHCLNLSVAELKSGRPCRLGDVAAQPAILLWGDSHADAISPAIDQIARRYGLGVINATHVSCPPVLGAEVTENGISRECRSWNEAVAEIARKPEVSTVILIARWAAYAHGAGYGPDASKKVTLGQDNRTRLLNGLERSLSLLQGKKVTLILSVPEQMFNVPSAMARKAFTGAKLDLGVKVTDHRTRQAVVEREILRIARRHGAQVIDPAFELCRLRCAVADGNTPLYYDNQHLSTRGAGRLTGLLEPAFQVR